ncbi:tRNA 2-thiouridine(34) synthase MnmA [Candidatus Saccharibacteria bacterium]|nr:tRNA 2-thiouridine(34) synthase MnmA [Candidatus Saccharibacteria bacterium]
MNSFFEGCPDRYEGGLRRPSPVTTGRENAVFRSAPWDAARAKLDKGLSTASERGVVYLGMSGGVDSSVSALLLKNAGYKVVGVYMKNWSRDLPGMKCPWAEDLADAKRVATKLGIDFKVFDFEKDYKEKVVEYMLKEFKAGRTPNPDVMCNEEIKFKLFFEKSLASGADFIATGHYAKAENGKLLLAKDENKDQTYFLYRISTSALEKTLFPLGEMKKPEVKAFAAKNGLKNAYKKESMGVCFVGEVGMKDFLREYIDLNPGEIRDVSTNEVLGFHDGAVFYTLGQRHGLYLGGGLPYYVVKKDLKKNIVYVSRNLNDANLWSRELTLENLFLRETPDKIPEKISVRLRHRAHLLPAKLILKNPENLTLNADNPFSSATLLFDQEIKLPASGQSAVFYSGDLCLGGGIIK